MTVFLKKLRVLKKKNILRVISKISIKKIDFFDEKLLLSVAYNSKSISCMKKMYRTFFTQNQFFYRFLWLICNKKFSPPRWGENHSHGNSALWHNMEFHTWLILQPLSKFEAIICILKKLKLVGKNLRFPYYYKDVTCLNGVSNNTTNLH